MTWYLDSTQDGREFKFSGHTVGTETTGYSLIISVARFDSVEDATEMYERVRDLLALDLSIDGDETPN